MLSSSAAMSTTSSSGWAASRATMSLTTPGCGMKAMSGVSLAWILVMISWLMFSTFCQSTVSTVELGFQRLQQAVLDGLVDAAPDGHGVAVGTSAAVVTAARSEAQRSGDGRDAEQ